MSLFGVRSVSGELLIWFLHVQGSEIKKRTVDMWMPGFGTGVALELLGLIT